MRPADQPFRKPLDHAERGIRTYFDDLDRAAVDTLSERFEGIAPEARLLAMRDLPTQFEGREQFEASYAAASGEAPGEGVGGFSQGLDQPAHVLVEDSDSVPEIVMHERVHQLSHPDAARAIGGELYEGVTEDIALDAARLDFEFWPAQGYPEETRRASQLREACGSEAVEKGYFQGDATELRQNLERRLQELPDVAEPPETR